MDKIREIYLKLRDLHDWLTSQMKISGGHELVELKATHAQFMSFQNFVETLLINHVEDCSDDTLLDAIYQHVMELTMTPYNSYYKAMADLTMVVIAERRVHE